MINKVLEIFKKEYQTLNRIYISKSNFLSNYKHLSSLNRRLKIAPVLKSNAYGHGLVQIAKILEEVKAPFFCVDSLYEAYELFKANIRTPILIMGYTDTQNFKVKKLPFSYAVFDEEILPILNQYQKGCSVHIFVDTGMHREGISLADLPAFLEKIKSYPNLKVEGLMSHFASTDNREDPLNRMQIENFQKALGICQENNIYPKWVHLANSDGLRNFNQELNFTTIARTGLALYGISSDPNIKPVLTLKSKIIQIKTLPRRARVGYSGTYTTKKAMNIGLLPLGYYDGVDRRLSNKGCLLVDKIVCPIAGRVSMNITTIDLSKVSNPYIGQEVIVYSNDPKDPNAIENSAKLCKTIPYDILIHLAASTKRIII